MVNNHTPNPLSPVNLFDSRDRSHSLFQLVELKNGETFNGHLVNCDNFMNITLREVYQTNPDGDRFWKLKECYIRGSTVRSFFFSPTLRDSYLIVLDKVSPDT